MDSTVDYSPSLLARLEAANRVREAQGQPPLTQRQIEHDLSLAAYDRALGEGRN